MQKELDAAGLAVPVRIFAINEAGYESGFSSLDASLTLPWLQDVTDVNAWRTWGVTYRDVVVIDSENRKVLTYNLTEHDLSVPTNYAELKDQLNGAATAP